MSEVVIFSASIDEPTYGPVIEKLEKRGIATWLFLTDRIASGDDNFSMVITEENYRLSIHHNNKWHDLRTIKAAWFRHPHLSLVKNQDYASRISIENEIESLLDSLWQLVPNESWLNDPYKMRLAQAKLGQLAIARHLGFHIPDTLVSNSWESINKTFNDQDIIMKMPRGTLFTAEGAKVLYCTKLDKDQRQALTATNPFPGIFQQYKTKKREWRVTVVGDDIFSAAIYTSNDAKDDWRKHQFSKRVEFKKEKIADDIGKLCLEYLNHFDLCYGAFDFIEDHDGQITFLECNTNGQYKWLEDMLGLPISDAIANVLTDKIKS